VPMADPFWLSTKVTVDDYRRMEERKDGQAIADFIHRRLHERYIAPVHVVPPDEKNGFLIMAVSCLLVETLESFWQGWESTEPTKKSPGKSKLAFREFFKRQWRFLAFRDHADGFYRHVRCGILHQGETTGGWRIRRNGRLFDEDDLIINATAFHQRLSGALGDYRDNLYDADWNSERWGNVRTKMAAVLKHCEKPK